MVVAAFTDDTVMTLAVANAIIRCTDCRTAIKCFARNFPNLPYGGSFWHWIWDPNSIPFKGLRNRS